MTPVRKTPQVAFDHRRHGTITCRACGVTGVLHVDTPLADLVGHHVHVRCGTCHNVFAVHCEWRGYHRRRVQLPSALYPQGAAAPCAALTVTSLSVGGLAFQTSEPLPCQPGEHYDIVVVLAEQPRRIVVRETIVITRVQGPVVGAAFSPPEGYNHALDFYMLSDHTAPARASGILYPMTP
jgi:hypothetical protein